MPGAACCQPCVLALRIALRRRKEKLVAALGELREEWGLHSAEQESVAEQARGWMEEHCWATGL